VNTILRSASVLLLAGLLAGCAEHPIGPGPTTRLNADQAVGVPFSEGLASPAWQALARDQVAGARLNPVAATRVYATLAVAAYRAVLAVERAEGEPATEPLPGEGLGRGGRERLEAERGAVAGASAVVLTSFFPSSTPLFEETVQQQENAGPGGPHPAFAAGEQLGRQAGTDAVAAAATDGYTVPWTGTVPVGPGLWFSAGPALNTVANAQLTHTRPFFLTSRDQFRPGPPPAFGSPEYLTALAEIRQISDTRTSQQTAIAIFWAMNAGTMTTAGFWNVFATKQIEARGLSEREAAHVYALLNTAMFDASIGCWDAKLTYWFIRPSQADHGIKLIPAVGLPNHPSYPSGHSCASSAAGEVLSHFFADQRDQLDAMVTEAGLARMYAGIHYRFDVETGRSLGRSVALFAIAADASGNTTLTSPQKSQGF
jgi:membrane-associated phospholipid phosphatase